MGATRQPFIYEAVQTPEDERFSTSKFDPKRVTRSSYEQKAPKRKQRGPLVSVNRHPEYVSPSASLLSAFLSLECRTTWMPKLQHRADIPSQCSPGP